MAFVHHYPKKTGFILWDWCSKSVLLVNGGSGEEGVGWRIALTCPHCRVWWWVGCRCTTQGAGLGAPWWPREVGGEGPYIYLCLIRADVQQKLTQHWKAIILQYIIILLAFWWQYWYLLWNIFILVSSENIYGILKTVLRTPTRFPTKIK